MKRIMAVYDVDPFYADRFAEFANRKETMPFMAVAFTSLARLKAFVSQQPVEVLLVGDEVDAKDLEEIPVGQVIRLSESGMAKDSHPAVYKYQASDSVLREVMACYQVKEQPALHVAVGRKSRILGIYSPVGRCGKTAFAMTLGQVLARDAKVLLLSLETFSGLSRLTGTTYDSGLSDLLYYFQQGEYSRLRLGSVVYNWGGLDYVPPVACAEDLEEVTGKELASLVDRIAADGTYETIVVDMGRFDRGLEPLFPLCGRIYVPVREDAVSAARMEEWKEYLNAAGWVEIWEKLCFLKLPFQHSVATRETWLEQLLWGELGDFVRELAGGQRR